VTASHREIAGTGAVMRAFWHRNGRYRRRFPSRPERRAGTEAALHRTDRLPFQLGAGVTGAKRRAAGGVRQAARDNGRVPAGAERNAGPGHGGDLRASPRTPHRALCMSWRGRGRYRDNPAPDRYMFWHSGSSRVRHPANPSSCWWSTRADTRHGSVSNSRCNPSFVTCRGSDRAEIRRKRQLQRLDHGEPHR